METKRGYNRKHDKDWQAPADKLKEVEASIAHIQRTAWRARTTQQLHKLAALMSYRRTLKRRIATGEWM